MEGPPGMTSSKAPLGKISNQKDEGGCVVASEHTAHALLLNWPLNCIWPVQKFRRSKYYDKNSREA